MMLPERDHIETDLVGQLDLIKQIAKPEALIDARTGGSVGHRITKVVEANLHDDDNATRPTDSPITQRRAILGRGPKCPPTFRIVKPPLARPVAASA